ncbi:ADP-forming succinate--CoA ligase subunit beta, partial [Candidatus Poribacteria bacterium]|nr:ADP-forming succinate--CoA ligase subunit beta [Candidatus Poribacteria bacterium]
HEYQAKEILESFGVSTLPGKVAETPEEAEAIAKAIDSDKYVIKAQIHAGGRGKGGGVKLANSIEKVKQLAADMIGMQLVTPQTGPEGKQVRKILIVEAAEIQEEYYLALLLDRETSQLTLIGSEEGGMDIEEVAARTPEKIIRTQINPAFGLTDFQAREFAYRLITDLTYRHLIPNTTALIISLYNAFIGCDCSLIEINPLAIVGEDDDLEIVALDSKVNLDDNSLWRHAKIADMRDPHEEDPSELEASESGLSYIRLDGNIGCMVNGAGLAMATMDIIKQKGGEPANFLDVGGGASVEAVAHAFRLILADENVKAVLVNIFGGIMKCDTIATGIVDAAKQVKLNVPLVVRLEGTNVELGKQIIAESDLNLQLAEGLSEAAELAVNAVNNI